MPNMKIGILFVTETGHLYLNYTNSMWKWPLFPKWKDRCPLRRGQEDSQLTTQGLLTNRDPN